MSKKYCAVYALSHPWVDGVIHEVAAQLAPDVDVVCYDPADTAAAATHLPRADFVVCLKLSTEQVALLGRCRLVHHNGVGYDGIDRAALHARGIPLAITPALTAETVAEHTLMLILALNKQLVQVHASMQRGEFNLFGWRAESHTLFGKTVGIVGLGRIGRRVAELAHAFGCRVIYNDLVAAPAELATRLNLTRLSLEGVVAEADVLTVHVPLTELTRGMFGAAEFARMQPSALYINASRGATYDLDALYAALAAGNLRGAGLDVYQPEPPPANHPILQLPNVICTPHIASGTVERQYAIVTAQMENFLRVLRGEAPKEEIKFEG